MILTTVCKLCGKENTSVTEFKEVRKLIATSPNFSITSSNVRIEILKCNKC